MDKKTAIIIGAGPAGLTAAYELLEKTKIRPIIFEALDRIGGISATIDYKGNKMDFGGHRFFSKSDRIMHWWQKILPLQGAPAKDDILLGRKIPLSSEPAAPNPEEEDRVMLVRSRLSRIIFLQKFFNYPVSLSLDTFRKLGLVRMAKIFWGYLRIRIWPIKEEKSLEDFYINRFGGELYRTFFKDYTEKLWGISCREIKPDWGAQRIKGVSISEVVWQAIRSRFFPDRSVAQKKTETSLIESFIYPKYGPGHLWGEVAEIIKKRGGEIYLNHEVSTLFLSENRIGEIEFRDKKTGQVKKISADFYISTMPVKDLIAGIKGEVPALVRQVAAGLPYRDFFSVGLLLKKLSVKNETKIKTINDSIPYTWIYVQEPKVRVCRVQFFNNWSPYLVKDLNNIWLGMEYVCSQGDDLWSKNDKELIAFATDELVQINLAQKEDIIDAVVARMEKTYPAYFGSYDDFGKIREFTDKIENLFLIGRNGMHRYNNQDHSMLSAMAAVENIASGVTSKDNIWEVNAEKDYHEEKKE